MKVQQPKEVSITDEEKILGQWGQMRRAYLMEHLSAAYAIMSITGELFPHLYQVDEQAELILEQMVNHYPAPNRNADPMTWVRHMNAVKAQAEEIIQEDFKAMYAQMNGMTI